ncbi:single-stranded DNA-binding protein [Planococcus lenghuensis]|uniref:single-stranded DNA-binding protein n=1 Tax=Planococcus lenghuensis TaxID=2213202 RepID=UPI000984C483|nr:single-stranded DNA-binding protein [Planococcus lenghuensis]
MEITSKVYLFLSNGVAACTFTLAVNRTFTNASGEKEADFINCVTWRKQAENTANFLKKGSLAGVEGRIQTRSYEKDGQRVYVTEVVADSVQFLEPKSARSEQQGNQGGQQNQNSGYNQGNINRNQQNGNSTPAYSGGGYSSGGGQQEPFTVSDDDLPF